MRDDVPPGKWLAQVRERRRLKRLAHGDSPEKRAQRHKPKKSLSDRFMDSDSGGLGGGGS